jgi:two-component system response regulator PilR (NtrC family)
MEAEFFGYRKGAFTGAAEDRDGFFQAANGGTLMLDEVADLPLPMQVKLLRAIQERRVRKVGSTVEEPVDVRIISATHQDLAACVEAGKFRQDLYYRLNVIELGLPPLRERSEDIGLLSDAILRRLSGGAAPALSQEALALLQAYAFPGNVRELENILERALAFASGDAIAAEDLALRPAAPRAQAAQPAQAAPAAQPEAAATPTEPPAAEAKPALPGSLTEHLDAVERDIIRAALLRTRYNRTQAAELLGLTLRQLRYRMQRLDIHEPD